MPAGSHIIRHQQAQVSSFEAFHRRIFHDVTLPNQHKNWSIMAASERNSR